MGNHPEGEPAEKDHNPLWVDAHTDALAGVQAYSNCIAVADVCGDGNFRLVIASRTRRLLLYGGTSLTDQCGILDVPSALCVFYSADDPVAKIAVACGVHVLVYQIKGKTLKPAQRFLLPATELNPTELGIPAAAALCRATPTLFAHVLPEFPTGGSPHAAPRRSGGNLWKNLLQTEGQAAKLPPEDADGSEAPPRRPAYPPDGSTSREEVYATLHKCVEGLEALKDQGPPAGFRAARVLSAIRLDPRAKVSYQTMELLSLDSSPAKQLAFIKQYHGVPIEQRSRCNHVKQVPGCLVAGTENSRVLLFDTSGNSVQVKVALPSVPVFIQCIGCFTVEYRIIVACRNSKIYTIKNGSLLATRIDHENPIAGLVVLGLSPFVLCLGCVDVPALLAPLTCPPGNTIVVGTPFNQLEFYQLKGKKLYSIYLPSGILEMAPLCQEGAQATKGVII
eukprot:gene4949-9_t